MKPICDLRATIMPPHPIDPTDFYHSDFPFPIQLLSGRVCASLAEVNREEDEDDA